MNDHIRSHANALAGFGTSAIGAITANQEHVEWWLRCGASGVAILAGLATIWSIFFKKKPAEKSLD